ncbi:MULTISPECIES: response regulator transcription factor [unclassified Streptomyces]|uniref:response regulator transcription factor n=1 Tax=unclassified Streptomyces TaxID=2593676 RepID=UPI0031BA756D
MIVDNEPLIRAGLEHILDAADDIDVVACSPVGQAVETIQEQRPRVVLLDSCTSDADTLSTGIGRMTNPPAVCVLSASSNEEFVATALASGAAGYIPKDTAPERLVPLVRSLAQGWTMMSSPVSHAVVTRFLADITRTSATSGIGRLTTRERDVLVLLAAGLSNAAIGGRLHLSLGTVKDHVRSLLSKLGVERRVQAALQAERAGLLRP